MFDQIKAKKSVKEIKKDDSPVNILNYIGVSSGQSINLNSYFTKLDSLVLNLNWDNKAKFTSAVMMIYSQKSSELINTLTCGRSDCGGIVYNESSRECKESINLNFDKIPKDVTNLLVFVTCLSKNIKGEFLEKPSMSINKSDFQDVIIGCDIKNNCKETKSMILVNFFKKDNIWMFKPISESLQEIGIIEVGEAIEKYYKK